MSKLILLLLIIGLAMNAYATGAVTTGGIDVSTKMALMEKVINSLVQQSQEAQNKLHTVDTQLTDLKTQNEKLNAEIKTMLQKDAVTTFQLQQALEQIKNLQQEKTTPTQTLSTQVQIQKLQQEKIAMETTVNQATKKLQVLESQLQEQASSLKASEATVNAKQSLSDKQIRDLGVEQQSLDQKITSQAAQIKKLGTEPKINIKQVTWKTHESTDSGVIQKLNFTKKSSDSGLEVSFYGNIASFTTKDWICSRWWFELNGLECTKPGTVEGIIHTSGKVHNYIPTIVSGICYGIPAGNVNIIFKVGACPSYDNLGDAVTGGHSISRIIVEEV